MGQLVGFKRIDQYLGIGISIEIKRFLMKTIPKFIQMIAFFVCHTMVKHVHIYKKNIFFLKYIQYIYRSFSKFLVDVHQESAQ